MLKTATKMTHVPFPGAAPALVALLGKQVDVLASDIPGAQQHIAAGTLKALAITSRDRSPALPSVPTMLEAGVPGYEAVGWQGIMVPAGTPRAIIDKLNAEINKAINEPAFKEQMQARGVRVAGGTPEEFAEFVRQDIQRWKQTVEAGSVEKVR